MEENWLVVVLGARDVQLARFISLALCILCLIILLPKIKSMLIMIGSMLLTSFDLLAGI